MEMKDLIMQVESGQITLEEMIRIMDTMVAEK